MARMAARRRKIKAYGWLWEIIFRHCVTCFPRMQLAARMRTCLCVAECKRNPISSQTWVLIDKINIWGMGCSSVETIVRLARFEEFPQCKGPEWEIMQMPAEFQYCASVSIFNVSGGDGGRSKFWCSFWIKVLVSRWRRLWANWRVYRVRYTAHHGREG